MQKDPVSWKRNGSFCFSLCCGVIRHSVLRETVLIISRYSKETRPDGLILIHSNENAICPDCGYPLTGYDRRRRTVLDDAGNISVYLLRRLYCRKCNRLHLEAPDTIIPQKHYEAQLITKTLAGTVDYCPADDSTIRRWRKGR